MKLTLVSTPDERAHSTDGADTRLINTGRDHRMTARRTPRTTTPSRPPRPAWAAEYTYDFNGGRVSDGYWWSSWKLVAGVRMRLGSSYTHESDGHWTSDGPAMCWLEEITGCEKSTDELRKVRDALTEIIDQADPPSRPDDVEPQVLEPGFIEHQYDELIA